MIFVQKLCLRKTNKNTFLSGYRYATPIIHYVVDNISVINLPGYKYHKYFYFTFLNNLFFMNIIYIITKNNLV